jgi:hypothetical protein
VESHVQLQETLDRASSEIAEAVKAIDERNKAKSKDKAVKKEEKSKSEEPKPKTDETLPLWWTDKSAAAPGTQPQPHATHGIVRFQQFPAADGAIVLFPAALH